MTRFTPEAQTCLEDYLADVRSAVAGHQSVSPDEIEQDVRDHVVAALEGTRGPIIAADVAAVLERLGPPNQWVADEPRSMWKYLSDKLKPVGHKAVEQIKALPGEAYQAGRGIAARVRDMSNDWRLAYLAFGLFVVGLIAFPLFPAFLIGAYFAARADVALARERGETLGARRWLVYPPMAILSVALLLIIAIWPIAPAVALSHQIPRSLWPDVSGMMHVSPGAVQPVSGLYLAIGTVSLWWCICSLIVLRFPNLPGVLFPPFGKCIRRQDATLLFLLAGTAFVCWLSRAETAWAITNMVLWRT
jgi:hypothetical protein